MSKDVKDKTMFQFIVHLFTYRKLFRIAFTSLKRKVTTNIQKFTYLLTLNCQAFRFLQHLDTMNPS